jgi:hypothetical protein
MRKSTTVACVLMFGASFLLIAAEYDAMAAELPVMRIPIAGIATIAVKSVFTAFRVPLMNLTHGLMAAVMLSRTPDFADEVRKASYAALFSTLLFAIALKSDFEALEISGLTGPFARWATVGTVASVLGGLALAVIRGRAVPIPWTELRLSIRDKILLVGLFASYLVMVVASWLVSHRV